MTDLQRNALNQILGTTRSYKGENLTITKFKEVEDVTTVFTTSRNINFLPDELEDFVNGLADPVTTVVTTEQKSTTDVIMYTPSEENMQLKGALMDALKRVQGNAGFIPQAKSIVDIANTMVNIQKSEMQFIQMSKSKK